jgi:hypothetical protein
MASAVSPPFDSDVAISAKLASGDFQPTVTPIPRRGFQSQREASNSEIYDLQLSTKCQGKQFDFEICESSYPVT